MPMNQAGAVIFDLGNVLVTFDHTRTYRALALALSASPDDVQKVVEAEIRPHFDTGHMSESQVRTVLEERFGAQLEPRFLASAWADVFAPMPEMVRFLARLSTRVRLALLSNTDPIHLPWVAEKFGFLHHFESLVLSYEVGHAKPSVEIFKAALSALSLPASACLFIDDIAAYCHAAQQAGMAATHHQSPTQTIAEVEKWLLLRGID